MSENNNSEFKDIPLAKLEDGEALIPHQLVEKYKEAVKAQEERNDVISSDKMATSPNLSVTSNEENVIGSASAEKKEAVNSKVSKEKNTVAIYSTKNVTWSGVGQVSKGYNIVTRQAADKWATRNHIRIATPEEVAGEYGI
jgi:hypothetical protein